MAMRGPHAPPAREFTWPVSLYSWSNEDASDAGFFTAADYRAYLRRLGDALSVCEQTVAERREGAASAARAKQGYSPLGPSFPPKHRTVSPGSRYGAATCRRLASPVICSARSAILKSIGRVTQPGTGRSPKLRRGELPVSNRGARRRVEARVGHPDR